MVRTTTFAVVLVSVVLRYTLTHALALYQPFPLSLSTLAFALILTFNIMNFRKKRTECGCVCFARSLATILTQSRKLVALHNTCIGERVRHMYLCVCAPVCVYVYQWYNYKIEEKNRHGLFKIACDG